ncbi:MAG: flavin reductase [Desulfobacteraceae bacterium]|nr:flavin reductase [Desulfobacteraceae bacterium]
MLVLGLQGSPRKKGNTRFLLSAALKEAREKYGAHTQMIDVDAMNIVPCKEYIVCEKKGFCPIDDDMRTLVYPLLRRADIIIAASPVFFYNVTAQLKALIDRSQTLWARKYKLKLKDPGSGQRRGFLMSVGATRGKQLFDGIHLTATYFFDAVDAVYSGSLTYRDIESASDMAKHPTVDADIRGAVESLCAPLARRRKILFLGEQGACRSLVAGAYARKYAGDKLDVLAAGANPAAIPDKNAVAAMAQKGIDLAFHTPRAIGDALSEHPPDVIVIMGPDIPVPKATTAAVIKWDMPAVDGDSASAVQTACENIEHRIKEMVETL